MGRGPVGEPAIIRYVNNSLTSVDDVSGSDGSMILIKTVTASSDSTISFVNGTSDVVLDSTYPIYLFKFINVQPATDGKKFSVGFRDGSTNYDATKTTTYFYAYHSEDDTGAVGLGYEGGNDLAQGTGFQPLSNATGSDSDEAVSGEMYLFNPCSTTFVKHFMARTNSYGNYPISVDSHIGGYCNVTAAIDAVQFKYDSGNIASGTIKLYGIKDS